MARGRRRRTRDTNVIANLDTMLLRSSTPKFYRPEPAIFVAPQSPLQELEDRREFSPEIFRPARAFRRSATQLVVPNVNKERERNRPFVNIPASVGFNNPRLVAICVRRKRRREVLHALGRTGRRKWKSRRVPRWSEWSYVRC